MRNDHRGNIIDRTAGPLAGKYRVQKQQLSLVSCLEDDQEELDEGTDINEMQTIVNDKKVQAKFFSALQAAAGPLGMAAPNGKNPRQPPSAARARAASDPLSQTASHVFQEPANINAKYKNSSLYHPIQRNAKQTRGAASGGESDWEDYNDEEYGLDVPTENEGFPSNARNSKASKMNHDNNLYKVAASSGNPTSFSLFPAQRSNNNDKAMMRSSYPPAVAAGKSARFRAGNDDYMDVDTIAGDNEDDEDEDMKPFVATAGRTVSRATGDAEDDTDYPAFGLTELGKMERQIAAPKSVPSASHRRAC